MGINYVVYNRNQTSYLGNLSKYIALGPLTSTIAAEYLLFSAPAAQPRNNILGFIVTGVISLLLTFIPISMVPKWAIVTLSSVSSIFTLGKLGIPCPPAASFSVVITAGEEYSDWMYILVTIASVTLLSFLATLINNLNRNRQYPIYWGFLPNNCRKGIHRDYRVYKKYIPLCSPT
jgi:CBS-domain-containing membrane protein